MRKKSSRMSNFLADGKNFRSTKSRSPKYNLDRSSDLAGLNRIAVPCFCWAVRAEDTSTSDKRLWDPKPWSTHKMWILSKIDSSVLTFDILQQNVLSLVHIGWHRHALSLDTQIRQCYTCISYFWARVQRWGSTQRICKTNDQRQNIVKGTCGRVTLSFPWSERQCHRNTKKKHRCFTLTYQLEQHCGEFRRNTHALYSADLESPLTDNSEVVLAYSRILAQRQTIWL